MSHTNYDLHDLRNRVEHAIRNNQKISWQFEHEFLALIKIIDSQQTQIDHLEEVLRNK